MNLNENPCISVTLDIYCSKPNSTGKHAHAHTHTHTHTGSFPSVGHQFNTHWWWCVLIRESRGVCHRAGEYTGTLQDPAHFTHCSISHLLLLLPFSSLFFHSSFIFLTSSLCLLHFFVFFCFFRCCCETEKEARRYYTTVRPQHIHKGVQFSALMNSAPFKYTFLSLSLSLKHTHTHTHTHHTHILSLSHTHTHLPH